MKCSFPLELLCIIFLFFQDFNISSFLIRKECQTLTVLVGLEEPLLPSPCVHTSFISGIGPWTINQLSNLLPKGNHHQSRKRCWEQKLLFNVLKKISVENSFHSILFPTALSFENKDSFLSLFRRLDLKLIFLTVMCHLNSTNFTLPLWLCLSGPQSRDTFVGHFPKHSRLLLPDAGTIPVQIINKGEHAKPYKS